jgi:hypothetical protein
VIFMVNAIPRSVRDGGGWGRVGRWGGGRARGVESGGQGRGGLWISSRARGHSRRQRAMPHS